MGDVAAGDGWVGLPEARRAFLLPGLSMSSPTYGRRLRRTTEASQRFRPCFPRYAKLSRPNRCFSPSGATIWNWARCR